MKKSQINANEHEWNVNDSGRDGSTHPQVGIALTLAFLTILVGGCASFRAGEPITQMRLLRIEKRTLLKTVGSLFSFSRPHYSLDRNMAPNTRYLGGFC